MNRWLNALRWTTGTVLLGGALTLGALGIANLAGTSGAWAGDDERESGEYEGRVSSGTGMTPDPDYAQECSVCHLAYPAGLLPARSWQVIMAGLDNHFGENAELPPAQAQRITDYLVRHAADASAGRRSAQFQRGLAAADTPLRITELPFFTRKHGDIPARMVSGNPDVGSFSQCQACHGTAAERGVFNEDTVDIPGFGRWDD